MPTTSPYERVQPLVDALKNDPEALEFVGLLSVNYLAVLGRRQAVEAIAAEAAQCLQAESEPRAAANV